MQEQRKALGKGLGSLIPTAPPVASPAMPRSIDERTPTAASTIPIQLISPNRYQPRQMFDEERIRDLADSIKAQGMIQPLIVTPAHGGRYELIAGERRLRAARMLGLPEVPVIIKDVDEAGMLAVALIENVQREDLNPIEEASALQELITEFGHSQEEVATKVGKSRPHVANCLRLLKLPKIIQDDVAAGRYTAGHARALLSLTHAHDQLKMREFIVKQMPTVRDVEMMVQGKGATRAHKKTRDNQLSPQLGMLIDEMVQALGTKVRLTQRAKGAGRLYIDFYSPQDLDRIYRRIVS